MNTKAKVILSFLLGFGAGAFTVYYAAKKEDDYYSTEWQRDDDCLVNAIEAERERREEYDELFDKDQEYRELEHIPYNTMSGAVTPDTPYVILTEEFNEGNPEYDKVSLAYYEEDDTLTDDNEEIIPNPEDIIGYALSCFGQDSNDPDIVYVRNEKLGIDYEVCRIPKSYQATVLGITDLPPKKRRVKYDSKQSHERE